MQVTPSVCLYLSPTPTIALSIQLSDTLGLCEIVVFWDIIRHSSVHASLLYKPVLTFPGPYSWTHGSICKRETSVLKQPTPPNIAEDKNIHPQSGLFSSCERPCTLHRRRCTMAKFLALFKKMFVQCENQVK